MVIWVNQWRTHTAHYLLCTKPGRRPGTAKGGERARPGWVLVFFVHFWYAHISSGKWKLHLTLKKLLLVPTQLLVTTLWSTHLRSGKRKPLFNETYYWLLLVTALWSAHLRSGKRKPLFNETYFWLILVTTLWSAHLRSGKRKPLFNETNFWLLLVTGYYTGICTLKVREKESTFW